MRWLFAFFVFFLPTLTLAEEEQGGHAPAGLPQLDASTYPSQLFWLAVMFVVLYGIFSRWTLPGLSATMEERAQRIHADLEKAGELKTEAETVQAAYEARLAATRAEAASLFAEAEEEIKIKTRESLESFRKDAAAQIVKAEDTITKAKVVALQEIENQVDIMAKAVADKFLKVGK